jgi:hypothetical protein
MVVLQLHGIPEWIAPAGARPGGGVRSRAQRKVQTSGYSIRCLWSLRELGEKLLYQAVVAGLDRNDDGSAD